MQKIIHKELTKELLKDWDDLWKRSSFANPFNSPEWCSASLEAFGYKEILLLTLYSENRLVAVVPLIKEKPFGVKVYTPPAAEFIQRQGFLYDDEIPGLLKRIIKELKQLDNVVLKCLDNSLLEEIRKGNNTVKILDVNVSPLMHINQNGEPLIAGKNQILRKAKKHIEKFVLKRADSKKNNAMKLIKEIDEKSQKQKYLYGVFSRKENLYFFKILSLKTKQILSINFLYLNKKAVAYEIGFVNKNEYLDSERAYLSEYGYLTPGKILMVKLAESLASGGFEIFDLGPGIDNFKRSLSKNKRYYYDFLISNNYILSEYLVRMIKLRKFMFNIIFKNKYIYYLYKRVLSHK